MKAELLTHIIFCNKNTCEQIKTLEGTKIGCYGVMNQVHIQPFFGQKRQKASGLAEEHRTFLLLHLYSVME